MAMFRFLAIQLLPIYLALGLSAHAAGTKVPSGAEMADRLVRVVQCYRDGIYETARFSEWDPPNGRSTALVRRDLVESFLGFLWAHSLLTAQNSDLQLMIRNHETACGSRAQSNTPDTAIGSWIKINSDPDGEIIGMIAGLPANLRALAKSVLLREYSCWRTELGIGGGLMIGAVGGGSGAICKGNGGQRWVMLGGQGYVGFAAVVALLVGISKTDVSFGWDNARWVKEYSGIVAGGAGLGLYGNSDGNRTWGAGVVIAPFAFVFVGPGQRIEMKISSLPDDKAYILEKLSGSPTPVDYDVQGL